jgi:hypothetical protein
MDGTQRASALAERLAQVLPEGFSISSDGVSVTLGELGPLVMVGSEHQMAMPGAKVVDDVLELWYGDEDAPAIRFQPIKLRD